MLISCGVRVKELADRDMGASRINMVVTTAAEVAAVTYLQCLHVGSTSEGPDLTGDRSEVNVSGADPVTGSVIVDIRV